MTIFNLGSINIDHVYRVPHLPAPGETIAATECRSGLGGKGANQSIAIARAGGEVRHIGAIGEDADWTKLSLQSSGVDVSNVATVRAPTGHAIISVDQDAENAIVLFQGANVELTQNAINEALQKAKAGDWLLLQNETNLGPYAAEHARDQGLKVAYCAAPFDLEAIKAILPFADLLCVNEIEEAQIRAALPGAARSLSQISLLVTRGAKGASWIAPDTRADVSAFKVSPVDTTGAGDTFLGYALAALDGGQSVDQALTLASAAAAIQVTRPGAAEAIPDAETVFKFLETAQT